MSEKSTKLTGRANDNGLSQVAGQAISSLSSETLSLQAIIAIQGSDSISLCHSGIVKGRVDEIFDAVVWFWLRHDRLPDMQNFCGVVSETVDVRGPGGGRKSAQPRRECALRSAPVRFCRDS